jgi:hypothetical protein
MLKSGFQRVMLGFALSVLCTLVGCGPSATGAFDDKGYQHAKFGYRVDATHASDPEIANGSLLGSNWKLDNFYFGETNSLVQKSSEQYRTEYDFDTNDDGKSDFSHEDFLYDLRFKHLQHDAVIWLRTIPISDDLRDKELRVLMQRYVDEVSGAGFEAVKLGPTTTLIREKRFGASIVDRGPFKLAGQDAYETTFDVANVDEIAVNPSARRVRVRIVLVRTPFEYAAKPKRNNGLKGAKYSVLMLAGYANLPEDFATDEKAFQQLLDHTSIGGKRGTTAVALESSPNAAADAKAPAAAPPAPAGSPSAPAAPAPAAPESETPPSAAPRQ